MGLKTLLAKHAKLESEYAWQSSLLAKNILDAARRYVVKCQHCKKSSKIGSWGFVQCYWYEGPHGCSGGDQWHMSKAEISYVVCPRCNTMNYLYNHPQREEILRRITLPSVNKKELFAILWEKHGDHDARRVYPYPIDA